MLPNRLQSLRGRHALLGHEEGGDDGSRTRPAHHAVDDDDATAIQGLLDEVRRSRKKSRNVGRRVIVHVEPEVANVVHRVLGGRHRHVSFGRVEHVCHAHAFQIVEILHSFAVRQVDARVDFVAVDVGASPLLPVGRVSESGHGSVFARPRVQNGIDEFVASPLLVGDAIADAVARPRGFAASRAEAAVVKGLAKKRPHRRGRRTRGRRRRPETRTAQ